MVAIFRIVMMIVGVIGGTMYLFKNLLSTKQWRKGISQLDLDILKESVVDLNQNLVDLDKEELKLLSLNKEERRIRKRGKKLKSGIFYSIYNEPLLSYAFLEYDNYRKLIYVSTSEQDFIYRIGPRATDVYCNNNYLGFLDDVGKLRAPVTKKMLISIENHESSKYQRIENQNKELAAVLNPLIIDSPNQRAVQYEELDDDTERMLALSLIFLNMVERT